MRVSVGVKEDGSKGIVLDAVPETAPIKPKAEIAAPAREATKPKKAKETVAAEAAPRSKAAKATASEKPATPPRKGSAVPKVPRKK